MQPTRAIFVGFVVSSLSLACATTRTTAAPVDPPAAENDIRQLKLADWQPRSMLRTKVSDVKRPAFPAYDVHNHLGETSDVNAIVRAMDQAGIKAVVNLDGYWGDRLQRALNRFDRAHPGRFYTFAQLSFDGIDDAKWSDRAAAELERGFQAGAKGLKIHKSLGLTVRYRDGRLMRVDDPKLDPIWELCAKHERPVMIHTADPAAFFTPLDRRNERWHELNAHPDWLFYGAQFPSRMELLQQRNHVVAKHPKTTFIGAHLGNNPEDLKAVGQWLDQYPNFFVDIDARISELGRQPYSARRFLIKYQDRVMFGTDTFPKRDVYRIYYRFLESDDEYWDVAGGHHRQGFWMVHGIFLPKDVLRKLYADNAKKLLASSQRPEQDETRAQIERVRAAIKGAQLAEAARLLGQVRERARGDWSLSNTVVELEATLLACQGKYDEAIATILAQLPAAAAKRGDDWTEWGFHHTLALLRTAKGDIVNALLEIGQARLVGEQGSWAFPGRPRMMQIRLGDAWLRAHLLRLRAEQLAGTARQAVLRYAEDARAEYRRLAKEDGGHLDSIAVLDVIFAVHDKNKDQALKAARRVDYQKNTDAEDLYLTWVGFDYGGDKAMAESVHRRMKSLDHVYAGLPLRLRWVEYDKASKRGRVRWTPRHPNGKVF